METLYKQGLNGAGFGQEKSVRRVSAECGYPAADLLHEKEGD